MMDKESEKEEALRERRERLIVITSKVKASQFKANEGTNRDVRVGDNLGPTAKMTAVNTDRCGQYSALLAWTHAAEDF